MAKEDEKDLPPIPGRIRGNPFEEKLPRIEQELIVAVGRGDPKMLKEVIAKGVNLNARIDEDGTTPLINCCEMGFHECVEILVDAGADLELTDTHCELKPIDVAALAGFLPPNPEIDIVSYLKSKGCKFSWRGAAISGDIDRILEFLENGQDIEERGGWYRRTAVQEAFHAGRAKIARFLIVKGAVVPRDPAPFEYPEVPSRLKCYVPDDMADTKKGKK